MSARRAGGFTLIEIVVTIVVVAVAMVAVALLVAQLGGRSAAPVLQTQALYLAEGYLEEAMLKAYADPDGVDEGCGAGRALWDDVADFACLGAPAAPTDAAGNTLPGLARYRISVTVGAPATVGGASTRRVEVSVTHLDDGFDVRLAALRAQY